MPRPTIDYLNARRALKPASGGTNYRIRERAIYAEDVELIKRRYPFKSQVDGGLKAALDAAGSVQALARILRLTPTTIYQWRQRIPAERIIQIEEATGVPRNVLRPDLYDGWTPAKRRRQSRQSTPSTGTDRSVEVKVCGTGFRRLYDCLGNHNFLLRLKFASEIAALAEQTKNSREVRSVAGRPPVSNDRIRKDQS
jgi:DNA-binding transcriptional regulator YdaS (Cro superfamily)